jgi:hypothetical protein
MTDQIEKSKESYGIQKDPNFESERFTLFESMYDLKSIYQKLLTRANREKNPEFRLHVIGGEELNFGIFKSGVFRKIRGYTDNYMVNAVSFTRDETLDNGNQRLENPYLQLDVWSKKKEKNTEHEIKTIGVKEAKKDLERLLGIELPKGIEVTI